MVLLSWKDKIIKEKTDDKSEQDFDLELFLNEKKKLIDSTTAEIIFRDVIDRTIDRKIFYDFLGEISIFS